MYYSSSQNFLFCHVPRTGGTSFSQHIKNNVQDVECLLMLQHLSMVKAKETLGREFDDLFKFAFVRNPWERLVSWYGLEAIAKVGFNEGAMPQYRPDSQHWQQFDLFLEHACTRMFHPVNGYGLLFSQWHYLADQEGNLLVDEIGRYENYSTDVQYFLSKLGIKNSHIEHFNASQHCHYSEYYSDFGKELVAEVFYDDISNFNYSFDKI